MATPNTRKDLRTDIRLKQFTSLKTAVKALIKTKNPLVQTPNPSDREITQLSGKLMAEAK